MLGTGDFVEFDDDDDDVKSKRFGRRYAFEQFRLDTGVRSLLYGDK